MPSLTIHHTHPIRAPSLPTSTQRNPLLPTSSQRTPFHASRRPSPPPSPPSPPPTPNTVPSHPNPSPVPKRTVHFPPSHLLSQTSRSLHPVEYTLLSTFEHHTRSCPHCRDPYEVYKRRLALCSIGAALGAAVVGGLEMRKGIVFERSGRADMGGDAARVEVPVAFWGCGRLLKAEEKRTKHLRRRRRHRQQQQQHNTQEDEVLNQGMERMRLSDCRRQEREIRDERFRTKRVVPVGPDMDVKGKTKDSSSSRRGNRSQRPNEAPSRRDHDIEPYNIIDIPESNHILPRSSDGRVHRRDIDQDVESDLEVLVNGRRSRRGDDAGYVLTEYGVAGRGVAGQGVTGQGVAGQGVGGGSTDVMINASVNASGKEVFYRTEVRKPERRHGKKSLRF